MLLSCPHCSIIGKISDIYRKFYGISFSSHKCARLFFVKQASDDAASFSVKDKYHISTCRSRWPSIYREMHLTGSDLSAQDAGQRPAGVIDHRDDSGIIHVARSNNADGAHD